MVQRYGLATALIVVDVQNDFADPAGSLSVSGGDRIIETIDREIVLAIGHGALVVATQDWHPPTTRHFAKDGGIWPVHCVAGSWGAALHPALTLPDEAPRIHKGANGEDGYSAFTMRDPRTGKTIPTELEALLREPPGDRGEHGRAAIDRVVIAGLATDYCVKETALDAVRLGFGTCVLVDAIAAVDLDPFDGRLALEAMRAAGVELGHSGTA